MTIPRRLPRAVGTALALWLAVVGCTGPRPDPAGPGTSASPSTSAPSPRPSSPSPSAAARPRLETARLTADRPGVQVDVAYPRLRDAVGRPVLERINRRMESWARQRREGFLAEVAGIRDEPAPPVPLSLRTTVAEAAVTARLVSVVLVEETYLGGAHPALAAHGLAFELATGRPVVLADLVRGAAGGRLTARIVDAVAEREGTWDRGRIAEVVQLETLDAFALSADGLVVYLDQYEVGPGALGVVSVTVDPAALAGVLDPDGPAAGALDGPEGG